jgi:hypothetical protein
MATFASRADLTDSDVQEKVEFGLCDGAALSSTSQSRWSSIVTLFAKLLTGLVILAIGHAGRASLPTPHAPARDLTPAAHLTKPSSGTLANARITGAPVELLFDSESEFIEPDDDEPGVGFIPPCEFLPLLSPLTTGLGFEARPPRRGRVAGPRPLRC